MKFQKKFKKHQLPSPNNYYKSLSLMIYLKTRGIESLGTVRKNRSKNVLFPSDTAMKSKEKGYNV